MSPNKKKYNLKNLCLVRNLQSGTYQSEKSYESFVYVQPCIPTTTPFDAKIQGAVLNLQKKTGGNYVSDFSQINNKMARYFFLTNGKLKRFMELVEKKKKKKKVRKICNSKFNKI
ncbi:hypothetical protein PYW07_002939 [Mythimna separata]|uniref:Uncharacterized protein n=1 Tax=Mythimna separata TaxID=271217 RepID=A0AAD8DQC7_MYTSE|nr:hypothetical protein PYW07_002939 [Mythimna separata]